jgi:virginiamycin A acetyltransferase
MEISHERCLQETHLPMRSASQHQEGKQSRLGPLLCWLYGLDLRTIRWMVRSILLRIEGGELYSLTLRDIMRKYHGVDIGLYTTGAAFVPWAFRPGTKIGRFCSIFPTVRAFNANHPMNLKSTHAFFYNPVWGLVDEFFVALPPIAIGNDVLIGHNAIILPSVRMVGDGAVIGAGSVVHEDVPPYAVVVGHPGRIVRYRFKKEVIADLLASRWWNKPLAELALNLEDFRRPLDGGPIR